MNRYPYDSPLEAGGDATFESRDRVFSMSKINVVYANQLAINRELRVDIFYISKNSRSDHLPSCVSLEVSPFSSSR